MAKTDSAVLSGVTLKSFTILKKSWTAIFILFLLTNTTNVGTKRDALINNIVAFNWANHFTGF